jgi:hypothetical protein
VVSNFIVNFYFAEDFITTWEVNLKKQTATFINGIIFKLAETKPGEYEEVGLNPKDIPNFSPLFDFKEGEDLLKRDGR